MKTKLYASYYGVNFLFRTPRPWWIDLASAIARLIHLFYFFRLKKKSFRLLRIKFLSWATRIFLFTWCVLLVTPAEILKWIPYRKRFNFEGIDRIGRAPCFTLTDTKKRQNWHFKQLRFLFSFKIKDVHVNFKNCFIFVAVVFIRWLPFFFINSLFVIYENVVICIEPCILAPCQRWL